MGRRLGSWYVKGRCWWLVVLSVICLVRRAKWGQCCRNQLAKRPYLWCELASKAAVLAWGVPKWRFCQNGCDSLVLKHGPRSLWYIRVCGCKNPWGAMKVSTSSQAVKSCSYSRPWSSVKGLSKSISHKTRKMVNYTWVEWSLRKLRWKLEQVLTCKLISKLEYRGDRLIELSSSWFTLKFLSG